MTSLLARSVAPPLWPPTTAQLVIQARTRSSSDVSPVLGTALHQFTDVVIDQIDVETVDLHRFTTILTKQMQQAFRTRHKFVALRSLATDPRRIASPDGRTAADVCGSSWNKVRQVSNDRAVAAIDGAHRFGEATVIQLAVLRTAECEIPWWGSLEWEQRVDAWSKTIHFAPKLKRTVAQTPELVADDLLAELIGG